MGKPKKNQILGLDLLRAGAALLVMMFHYLYFDWILDRSMTQGWPAAFQSFAPFFQSCWVGVEIFFVISGFVITYSSENITAGTFVRHRIVRLLPSVLICATLTAIVLYAEHIFTVGAIAKLWLRSVSFWPKSPWIDGSYWTLPIEVSFYALVFLCLLTGRHRLPFIMGALGIVSTVWNIVLGQLYHPNAIFLLAHGCFFVFGVFLYEALHRGFTLTRSTILAICFAGCLTAISHDYSKWATPLWLIGIVILVLSVKLNTRAQELAGPRGATLIRKIGLTTYPLYLLHDSIGWKIIKGLHQSAHLSYESAVLFSALLMLSAATIIMQYAEPRLAKQISGLLRAKSTAAVPVSSNP